MSARTVSRGHVRGRRVTLMPLELLIPRKVAGVYYIYLIKSRVLARRFSGGYYSISASENGDFTCLVV